MEERGGEVRGHDGSRCGGERGLCGKSLQRGGDVRVHGAEGAPIEP